MNENQDYARLHHNRLEQVPRKVRADLDIRWIAAHVGEQRIDINHVHLSLANEAAQHRREVGTSPNRLAEE